MAAVVPTVRALALDELLSQPADVTLTLHPPALVRDRVYGPLLRRASALAAAYAGPRSLGTTALVALERTEEVDAAIGDGGETVVLLTGVPADLDVTQVVDELGQPVWKLALGDVRQSFVEYQSASASEASLFVLPQRTWVVAAGPARARTREVLIGSTAPVSFPATDVSLAELSIRGGALVRRDARLRSGALAPIGRSLEKASFALTPGAEGVIVARFLYGEETAAEGAEKTVQDVIAAFRHSLERIENDGSLSASSRRETPPLVWLAAAGVERTSATVNVRAPIPRGWLDTIARADVSSAEGDGKGQGQGSASDVPWALWHRSASAPTLSFPTTAETPRLTPTGAQEPSQTGGSL
jgi:hypothetical protein